jgi:hypothetical protein
VVPWQSANGFYARARLAATWPTRLGNWRRWHMAESEARQKCRRLLSVHDLGENPSLACWVPDRVVRRQTDEPIEHLQEASIPPEQLLSCGNALLRPDIREHPALIEKSSAHRKSSRRISGKSESTPLRFGEIFQQTARLYGVCKLACRLRPIHRRIYREVGRGYQVRRRQHLLMAKDRYSIIAVRLGQCSDGRIAYEAFTNAVKGRART